MTWIIYSNNKTEIPVTDLTKPQPVVTGEAGEIIPGANTVENDLTEFNHPMFSLTSGVYDGQV